MEYGSENRVGNKQQKGRTKLKKGQEEERNEKSIKIFNGSVHGSMCFYRLWERSK